MVSTPETAIRAFLDEHGECTFDLPAYLESTLYAEAALARLTTFRRNIDDPAAQLSWDGQRHTYAAATEDVPAYRRIDWSRSDYWSTIPLIDKSTLRERLVDFVKPCDDPTRRWVRETSGTLGPPIGIPYDRLFAVDFRLYAGYKVAWLAGHLPVIDEPARVFCLSLFERKAVPTQVWADPTGTLGLTVHMPFDERKYSAASRLSDAVTRYRPTIVSVKPNMLEAIVAQVKSPLDWRRHGVTTVISGGAHLAEDVRESASALLGVPICNEYGLTEVGVVASECGKCQGLHVYEGAILPEVLDENGDIKPEGSGELVVSSVVNEAFPLLRYRTGDLVTLRAGHCACGRTGRRLVELAGRMIRNFRFGRGSEFSPTNLDAMFRKFPLHEYRVTQKRRDHVVVEVELLRDTPVDWRQLKAKLHRYLETELGNGVAVEVMSTFFSRTDPFQRYVSLL